MTTSATGGRARLADIARQAGVSEATVSRVFNDKPGVSADTRQAVLTALDVLGYQRPERLRKRSAGLLTLRVTLTNQRGETILEGQHKYLITYRPS